MRFVRLLYGLLAAWCVIVLIFAVPLMLAGANGMAMGSIAAVTLAMTAIPYIIVRSIEGMTPP